MFNSAVHLSQIRRLWDLMYRRLTPELAKLSRAGAREAAVLAYREFVDDYIRAMAKYARTQKGFIRALEMGDKDLARKLVKLTVRSLVARGEGPASVIERPPPCPACGLPSATR